MDTRHAARKHTFSIYIQCCDFQISLTHLLTISRNARFKSPAGIVLKFVQKSFEAPLIHTKAGTTWSISTSREDLSE